MCKFLISKKRIWPSSLPRWSRANLCDSFGVGICIRIWLMFLKQYFLAVSSPCTFICLFYVVESWLILQILSWPTFTFHVTEIWNISFYFKYYHYVKLCSQTNPAYIYRTDRDGLVDVTLCILCVETGGSNFFFILLNCI